MIESFGYDQDVPQVPRWLANDVGISPDISLRRSRALSRYREWRQDPLVRDLEQLPLFSSLTKKRRRVVEQLVTPVHIQEQTVVAVEGAPPREFIVVVDGTLEAFRRQGIVSTQGPGSSAGAAALLADRPRATSLVAATPLRALAVSRNDFARLLRQVPEVAQRLHAQIGRAALAGIPPELAA